MEGLLIAFFIGFAVSWLFTLGERLVLWRYRRREKWLVGSHIVQPVEPERFGS